jgi:hypothetical protein
MSSFECILLYPNFEGLTFDMDYYINKHMPMSVTYWKQFGFQRWRMLQLGPHVRSGEKPFSYVTVLSFNNADNIAENIQQAFKNGSIKPVSGDLPNFCNTRPLFFIGETIASWP